MKEEVVNKVACFFNRDKHINFIETPEKMVKIVRICLQTILPFCQQYNLNPERFNSLATISKDDKVAVRFILNGESWEPLPKDMEKKWEVFEEIMNWFIQKSHENPKMYESFVRGGIGDMPISIIFAEETPSPLRKDFIMTDLKMTVSREEFDLIKKNLNEGGYPTDLFLIDEEFLPRVEASWKKAEIERVFKIKNTYQLFFIFHLSSNSLKNIL